MADQETDFGQWLMEVRKQAGLSRDRVADGVGKSKTWLRNVEMGLETGGLRVPDKQTCLALGRTVGLHDHDEVWRRGRAERLAQFDPDLLEWHNAELELARTLASPDGMPGDVGLLVHLLTPLPDDVRETFSRMLKDLLLFVWHRPESVAPGETPEERTRRVDAMPAGERWGPVLALVDVLDQLTDGLPPDQSLELLSTLAEAQLTVRGLTLRATGAQFAAVSEGDR